MFVYYLPADTCRTNYSNTPGKYTCFNPITKSIGKIFFQVPLLQEVGAFHF